MTRVHVEAERNTNSVADANKYLQITVCERIGRSKIYERGMPLYMNLKHALAPLSLVADAKLKLP